MIPSQIYRDLLGISIKLTGVKANRRADIERTILSATSYVDSEDRRILGLLCSWVITHGNLVCIGKLRRIQELEQLGDAQIVSAISFLAVENGFHEWKKLCQQYSDRYLWGEEGTRALLKIRQPVDAFLNAGVLLPQSSLRLRSEDILPLEDLAKVHSQTQLRLLFGSNLRADAAFHVVSNGINSPTALMKAIGCSYEPAHRILSDFQNSQMLKKLEKIIM